MAKKNKKINKQKPAMIRYPEEVLRPVKQYLSSRLFGLEKRKKQFSSEDPFADVSRLNDNAAIDADAAERVGHMRVSAVKQTLDRSMIQIRKALTQIKIGLDFETNVHVVDDRRRCVVVEKRSWRRRAGTWSVF